MNAIRETEVGRKAAPARRQAAGDIAATAIASMAIAIPLVFYLHQHVEILRLGYEIESLKDRRVELVERSRELRVRKMQLAGLARVEEQAAVLGLVAPAPDDVYIATPQAAGDAAPPVAQRESQARMTARLE